MKKALLMAIPLSMILLSSSNVSAALTNQEKNETYLISKVNKTIDWDSLETMPIDKVLWTEDYGIRAQGQLCYDNKNLYVHLSAVEKDIRAENTEPLSPVYQDSCLEFFFKMDDSENYFNFEINPNGCLCIQFGPQKTDRIDIVRDDAVDYFGIQADRTSNGWEVFYKIPLSFIQLFYPDYRFKGELKANLYKCGNNTVHKHYLAWNRIDLEKPNFHCPEFFGTLHFE